MTKQEILDTLRQWCDKAHDRTVAADAAAEVRGMCDDYQDLKREADRLYFQWKHLGEAIEAIEQVDEVQP